MKKQMILAALTVLALAPVGEALAAKKLPAEKPLAEKGPEGRTRFGVLACEIDGGIGLVVGSSKGVQCTFENSQTGKTDAYVGNISKLGLDIGVTGKQYMRWAVYAPDAATVKEGFAGRYSGVSAGGAIGVAFGANALIGGSDKQIVLQPFSVQAGTGLNVAVGVSSMKIERKN